MFENYTEKARRTLYFARLEASEFGSPSIESQHLLLGLLREYKALVKLFPKPDAALDTLRRHITEHSSVRQRIPTSIDLPIGDECQRILLAGVGRSRAYGAQAHRH
jgi:ATP-dependent Clp protease ATP-binding subunit ClpC